MTRRRSILSVLVASIALVLTACAGLPTGGPVNEGRSSGDNVGGPDFSFVPDGPQPGATPEEIVEGFIRAGSGPGAGADWATARLFLAPSIREKWKPADSVTIDQFGDREYVPTSENSVTLSVSAVATVDSAGAYGISDGVATSLPFELAQGQDGEWRITEAPDGVVVDRDVFTRVFHRYSVMYFDPTWQFLVPDLRWFAANNAAALITAALVDGAPSDWLAESVANAFPESVEAQPSVPIESGVARVELSGNAATIDQTTLNRMQTQLTASLATAGVASAQMVVGTTPLTTDLVSTRSTRVTGPPLVETATGFGFLSGDELAEVPGLSEAMVDITPRPVAIQVAPARDVAAVRLADGAVARVDADGQVDVVDQRAELVDPSIDPSGFIWSVPTNAPAAVRVFSPTAQVDIAGAWPGASQIRAMAVSRDGTRLAAVVVAGGRTEIWVAGVVRGANTENIPVRLGAPVSLGAVSGAGAGLAWLDDTTVGVLAVDAEGAQVTEQLIGGPATTTDAPQGAVAIAGATSIATVRLRTEDGSLYVKRSPNWSRSAGGVLVLATQQGSPP